MPVVVLSVIIAVVAPLLVVPVVVALVVVPVVVAPVVVPVVVAPVVVLIVLVAVVVVVVQCCSKRRMTGSKWKDNAAVSHGYKVASNCGKSDIVDYIGFLF